MEVYQLIDYVYAAIGVAGLASIPFAILQFVDWSDQHWAKIAKQAEEDYNDRYNL